MAKSDYCDLYFNMIYLVSIKDQVFFFQDIVKKIVQIKKTK